MKTLLKNKKLRSVSHDLRSPLNVIQLSIENLRDGVFGPLSSEQSKVLDAMDRSCSKLVRLIDDFFAKGG